MNMPKGRKNLKNAHPLSKEHRQRKDKIGIANKGKIHSKETKKKNSEWHIDWPNIYISY